MRDLSDFARLTEKISGAQNKQRAQAKEQAWQLWYSSSVSKPNVCGPASIG
jgi:hypothetical protein